MKRVIMLLVLLPFLTAMTCDNDYDPENAPISKIFKVSVSPESTFTLQDTIWVEGIATSRFFDATTNDSISTTDKKVQSRLNIYKFVQPNPYLTAEGAVNKFKIISITGEFEPMSYCKNSNLQIFGELVPDAQYFSYKIGFKPLQTGDYIVDAFDGIMTNTNRHTEIAEDYPLYNHPDLILLDCSGAIGLKPESARAYFFKVR